MQLALLSLFAVIAVVLVARARRRDRDEYRRFKKLKSSRKRQRTFARWLRESFFVFGGLAIVVLLAAWPFIPLVLREGRTWSPIAWLTLHLATGAGSGFIVGAAVAFLVVMVVPVILYRDRIEEVSAVGDIAALLPRNRGELVYGAALSINAGVVEELLFRLGMPALLYGVTGNALISFCASAVLFGLLHIYQGVWGVVGATLLGFGFTFVYLLTGSIVVVMIVHALIDLRSLVLIPLVVRKVWRTAS